MQVTRGGMPKGKLRRNKRDCDRASVTANYGGNRGNRGHRGGRGRGQHRGRGTQGHRQAGQPHTVGPRLSEADVGITEFISQHDGFSAVMKHR